jgi:tRNA-splicing ligase RtcB (3'-phosphate/5'-hydroxy nucleic acid ligase)
MRRGEMKQFSLAQNTPQRLEDQDILARAETRDGIREEIPEAYKDVDVVIDIVHNAGLAKRVARLRPMGVIKG